MKTKNLKKNGNRKNLENILNIFKNAISTKKVRRFLYSCDFDLYFNVNGSVIYFEYTNDTYYRQGYYLANFKYMDLLRSEDEEVNDLGIALLIKYIEDEKEKYHK